MVYGYQDYQDVVAAAQNKSTGVKVGFFKLVNNGDEALVRFNISTVEDLQFATVHTVQSNGKWLKVNCLNPVGTYGHCALCEAAEKNNSIGKAGKKVFLQALVSYKDASTGQWAKPVPVIWERPASFSREIANKISSYGDLKQVLLKITRNGEARDMKTTYSLDYAVPTIFKPEMIPADFSAFNNFNIAKHSYWEKTPEDITTFLQTGSFPEIVSNKVDTPYSQPQTAAQMEQAYGVPNSAFTQSGSPFVQAQVEPAAQPVFNPQPAAQPQPAVQSATEPAARPTKTQFNF